MKIKRDQQKELKKIEMNLHQLELLSTQSGFILDDLLEMKNFPDISEQQRNAAFHQAASRQQVFEISRRMSEKKDREKVVVKIAGRR
jgi:hypothetical protein